MNNTGKDDTGKARLPTEVILLIIENLISETTYRRPILRASDVITKTLLNLTLVSKAVYPTASRLLWRNCLRIQSTKSLHLFRDFISRESVVTGRKPCEAYGFTKLFLAPFKMDDHVPFLFGEEEGELPSDILGRPSEYPYCRELEDHNIIEVLHEVLITLAPVLSGIIVDMPLRRINPLFEDSRDNFSLIREGFEALVNVEELVSINDELWLPTVGPEAWTKWPKLKRLALYNVTAGPELWKDMISCPQLEMAIFTRVDRTEMELWQVNIKDQWSRAWTEASLQKTLSFEDRVPYQGRKVIIALCDWREELPRFGHFTESWERLDPDNRIWIMPTPVGPDDVGSYSRYFPKLPRVWTLHRALRGSLWDDVYTGRCDSILTDAQHT
ncbi:hypothetical protein FPOAC2_13194 [Fusarium poae]|uniref:Uncharacterized protein n=1 Tax=Fusarium poae TaxID=36050 RepID=A0A1B8AI04_FUSPO|nr:hypothetical protein FPOAC1_012826 [Fusarium poae]KAG8667984.1 hypothetical protein FPOAC1_012826 [Fusarium poae]OBS20193.1 hypothetical protein FPOA_11915 [Fusarium poae]